MTRTISAAVGIAAAALLGAGFAAAEPDPSGNHDRIPVRQCVAGGGYSDGSFCRGGAYEGWFVES